MKNSGINSRLSKEALFKNGMISLIPSLVPAIAKKIVSMVPENSKVEDVLKNYKNYWEKIAPGVSMLALSVIGNSELSALFVAELNAEVARAIRERYSDKNGVVIKNFNHRQSEDCQKFTMTIAEATTYLKGVELAKFYQLLNSSKIDVEQKRNILNFPINQDHKASLAFVETLTSLTEDDFILITNNLINFSNQKSNTKAENKQKQKKAVNKKSKSKGFFNRESYFVRLAKEKGLM